MYRHIGALLSRCWFLFTHGPFGLGIDCPLGNYVFVILMDGNSQPSTLRATNTRLRSKGPKWAFWNSVSLQIQVEFKGNVTTRGLNCYVSLSPLRSPFQLIGIDYRPCCMAYSINADTFIVL